jgi:anti-sigma regulatory factor (Ser/Thr protein kinase)
MQTSPLPPLICRLGRSLDSMEQLASSIGQFALNARLGTSLANELQVVAEELFVNAVRYSTGRRGDIEVCLSLHNSVLTIRLVDIDVDQLDITRLPLSDLDLPIEQRRAGGMGLHIVRHFADRFYYSYDHGNGIITLEKTIKESDAADTH